MKKLIVSILSLWMLVNFTRCSESTPTCDSSEAKEIVLSIIIPEIKDQIIQVGLNYNRFTYAIFLQKYFHNNKINDNIDAKSKEYFLRLKEKANNIENGTLVDIRTTSKNDDIKKTTCSANFSANNHKLPITYDLQYTSEGDLYATVYGL